MTDTRTAPSGPPWRAARTSRAWLAVAAFIVLVFYPGIMSNDSIASLRQARSFEFNDWHPPVMAIIWSLFDRVVEGPAGMLVAQAALYAYGCAALCAHAFPRLSARVPRWFVVVVFSLFPPVMTLSGMIWKDIWMSAFLLLALVHLFRMRDAASNRWRYAHGAIVVLFCLAATAFRHNALAATAGLLAGAAYLALPMDGKGWRLLLASVAGVATAFALYLAVSMFNRLVAQPGNPTTAIYLYDMAGIIVYSGDAEAATERLLRHPVAFTDNRGQFLRRIYKRYSPAVAGNVISTTSRPDAPFSLNVYRHHDAEGVRDAHRDLVRTYPLAYLKHRTTAFSCLLQLCDRQEWVNHSYVLNPQYALPKTLAPDSVQYRLRSIMLSSRLAPLYHPGFWLLVTVAGGIIGFIRIVREPATATPSLLLFMGLSGIGLAFSLYFTSPIESFRYMHWVMLLGWTTLFMAMEAFCARRLP